jgi:hypothetical protein
MPEHLPWSCKNMVHAQTVIDTKRLLNDPQGAKSKALQAAPRASYPWSKSESGALLRLSVKEHRSVVKATTPHIARHAQTLGCLADHNSHEAVRDDCKLFLLCWEYTYSAHMNISCKWCTRVTLSLVHQWANSYACG